MKYTITITIDSDKILKASNLQHVKTMAEEAVIENMIMQSDTNIFINSRVTKGE